MAAVSARRLPGACVLRRQGQAKVERTEDVMALEDAKSEIDAAFTRTDLKGPELRERVFAGAPSFLRRRYGKDLSGVDIAVTGIPFDQAVTNRPARGWGQGRSARPRRCNPATRPMAGTAIRRWRTSRSSITATWPLTMRTRQMSRHGSRPMRKAILDAGAACFAMGGDHSVTLPLLRAHVAKHGPVALIQVDAHTDTWPDDDPAGSTTARFATPR
jgi:agmatinase